jgi:tRNA A-37 threonylcarbamoyl transferase component Bud32/DNA-binding beta-propeller fold protein YncE
MAELMAGAEFAGYQIEGVAGQGGMGIVYQAIDPRLDRPVAIKVIAPHLAGDPLFRVRFERESRLAARIRHPNVITVYGAGEHEGQLFVVMEYIVGTDLRAAIASEGRVSPDRAAAIIDQVGGALDAAHSHDLVHRDVKPANVLLSTEGRREEAYLTDFGLTKHASSDSGMTATGVFVGTLDYVAPEQITGEAVDARTDVYALGCVLYHALTGQVPYPRPNQLATIYAHVHEPPPNLLAAAPQAGAALAEVVAKAMATAPSERYATAGDVGRAALAACIEAVDDLDNAATASRPRPVKAAIPASAVTVLPGEPEALCVARGKVWVALPDDDAVVQVDASSGAVIGQPISVGEQPIALAGHDRLVLVANGGDGTLTRIDPASGKVVGERVSAWTSRPAVLRGRVALEESSLPASKSRIPTTKLMAHGSDIGLDGGTAWVALPGADEVMRFNWVAGQVARTSVAVARLPLALAVASGTVWVANYVDDSVSLIDADRGESLGELIAVPPGPVAIVSSDTGLWVLSSEAGCLTSIDPTSGRVVGQAAGVPAAVDAVAADGGYLWLLDGERPALVRFDCHARRVADSIPLEGTPTALAVSGGVAWITMPGDRSLVRIPV